jgi:RHH-type transcriptional regulator, proline utilization regulon repressor / proline dehydrogenase / delta 1-pyrroline-5-carboxylate dehydrogenase
MTELPPYAPEPVRRWHDPAVRAAFAAAVERQGVAARDLELPAVVAGRRVATDRTLTSVDPGRTGHVVAVSADVDAGLADEAVAVATATAPGWAARPATERAGVLVRAAAWLRDRRDDIAALQVFEAGKPWGEADADVCEAIDFCEYYAREAIRLEHGGVVQSPPGERNRLTYRGRGVAAVIAPWNFPLAIPTGMVTAALAAGNAVCFKPAEQTPAIAARLVEALEAAGLPEGVLSFLPGRGEVVGAHLVEHPAVALIAFTGSRPVGLSILRSAAAVGVGQRQIKRAITELGGKNPIVVDADADPDEAVPGIAVSAFAFAGQKCSAASRLIVHRAVYEPVVQRLVAHTELMGLGHPQAPGVVIGPVIDADAHQRLLQTQRDAADRFRVRSWREEVPDGGWYVGPMIVDEVEASDPLATDEHFGPILVVAPADSIDEAFAMANATDYALTAGVYSRSPETIARAGRELRAGNIYVNRGTTGAVVGRQPFGGFGMSGVGSKAGGPDYLVQFCDPVVVTENTLRQGFAADQLTG